MRSQLQCLIAAVILNLLAGTATGENGRGVITGTVRLTGKPPAIPMQTPDHDVDVCGTLPRPAQSLVLSATQAVRDVILYLGKIAANEKISGPADSDIVLDERDCEFVPRIQVARSGASLVLKNGDPLLHVVRIDSLGATNVPTMMLNVATPYAGFEKRYRLANFTEPTLLRAHCGNGHDWMVAYIAVLPHPWATVTDGEGRFSLAGVPAGAYKLYAWHEVLGTLTREVQVTGGRSTVVDLEFSTPK